MTTFEVLLSETARKCLAAVPPADRARIVRGMRELADDPRQPRAKADIKKLQGPQDPPLYRLRVGHHGILYFVVGRQVKVTEILRRSKAYRGR